MLLRRFHGFILCREFISMVARFASPLLNYAKSAVPAICFAGLFIGCAAEESARVEEEAAAAPKGATEEMQKIEKATPTPSEASAEAAAPPTEKREVSGSEGSPISSVRSGNGEGDVGDASSGKLPPRTDAEALDIARRKRQNSQAAEAKGSKAAAYREALSAWELVRSRSDPQCREIAKQLLSDVERLAKQQNRSVRESVEERRINEVPLITK